MNIQTKYFGTLEIQAETIIEFIQPIYGFEDCHRYTLLADEDLGSDLMWLQGIDQPEVCFMVANPTALFPEVSFQFKATETELLKVQDTKDIDVLCIVSLGEQFADSTVNLKSPLLFSPEHNLGMQSILDQDLPLKAMLA